MKIGDLVQVDVNPNDPYDEVVIPANRGIIVGLKSCEYMPQYEVYCLTNCSRVWLYEINIRVLNPA